VKDITYSQLKGCCVQVIKFGEALIRPGVRSIPMSSAKFVKSSVNQIPEKEVKK
jgi:hypothetical protein